MGHDDDDYSRAEDRAGQELRAQGWTAVKIGRFLSVSPSTIRNWWLGGNCRCGAPIDKSNGAKSSTACVTCANADRTFWTRELLIQKIQEWAERYGRPPGAMDWEPSSVRRHPDISAATKARKVKRFRDGDWPYTSYVVKRFGSWRAGLRAAGFESNSTGGSGHWEKAKRAAA